MEWNEIEYPFFIKSNSIGGCLHSPGSLPPQSLCKRLQGAPGAIWRSKSKKWYLPN